MFQLKEREREKSRLSVLTLVFFARSSSPSSSFLVVGFEFPGIEKCSRLNKHNDSTTAKARLETKLTEQEDARCSRLSSSFDESLPVPSPSPRSSLRLPRSFHFSLSLSLSMLERQTIIERK